jgi:hypothetical protein
MSPFSACFGGKDATRLNSSDIYFIVFTLIFTTLCKKCCLLLYCWNFRLIFINYFKFACKKPWTGFNFISKYEFPHRKLREKLFVNISVGALNSFNAICMYVLSRFKGGLLDGVWIGWLDLLTTYTRHSTLQIIQHYLCSTHFRVHRYIHTRVLSLH